MYPWHGSGNADVGIDDDLIVRMKFVGHVSRLCEWSHIKIMWVVIVDIMWLVGLVTMTLQF